jgi:prevent-host-death family protein
MREISVSQIRNHLSKILREIERGEAFIVTRYGRPIARLAPAPFDRTRSARAVEGIRALAQKTRGMTAAAILEARDEGRR